MRTLMDKYTRIDKYICPDLTAIGSTVPVYENSIWKNAFVEQQP